MSDPDFPEGGAPRDQPGKTRTWWHPLLARLLDHVMGAAYAVQEEVPVGKLPLRVDLLLIRREAGNLSEAARRAAGALLPLLNRFTLIQFKGPTDALEAGDLSQLLGCTYLWRSQHAELISQRDISLIVLARAANESLRDELQSMEGEMLEHDRGIFRLAGLPFITHLAETDVMADRGDPVLSLVSRVFLNERARIIEGLTSSGHGALLWYMVQQIHQFRSLGEGFAMQHKDSQYLGEVEGELVVSVLNEMPEDILAHALKEAQGDLLARVLRHAPEDLLARALRDAPEDLLARALRDAPEDLLARALRDVPEDRLARALREITPERLAAGLSDEQATKLRALLERRPSP